jgi:hypothetical protein
LDGNQSRTRTHGFSVYRTDNGLQRCSLNCCTRGVVLLSERCCCVCITMTGHKRKQGNEHNFFFLFSVGVTRGTLFALQTQSPRPPSILLSSIVSDMLQHWKGNTQQS